MNRPPMTNGIARCPFCGSTPHMGLGKVEHCQLHGDPFQRYRIWCPTGGVGYEGSHARVTGSDRERSIEEWNKRHD